MICPIYVIPLRLARDYNFFMLTKYEIIDMLCCILINRVILGKHVKSILFNSNLKNSSSPKIPSIGANIYMHPDGRILGKTRRPLL